MTSQQARTEAERCLQCFDAPCTQTCPSHIDIPKFIGMIRTGNMLGAAEVVRTANAMANVCGKVCPEEIFCQSVCNRGSVDQPIAIRELHYHATQTAVRTGSRRTKPFTSGGAGVAIIGGGPAGLSCAFELAKLGHRPVVFDEDQTGGVPAKSIPAFRLSPAELQDDTGFLSGYFTFRNERIDTRSLRAMKSGFGALFLAVGLGIDRPLGIPGEQMKGVIPVLKFLEPARKTSRPDLSGTTVVIVGGGNVSLDAAATAKRLHAREVILLYRRGEKEMKVWKAELNEARSLGIEIRYQTIPVEILGNGSVTGIRCRRTRLSDARDASGRPVPVEVEGSDYTIPAGTILVAIGQEMAAGIDPALRRSPRGYIAVDEHMQTSEPGIFAGGDAVSGEGTIVQAVGQGKQAAHAIHRYLSTKSAV